MRAQSFPARPKHSNAYSIDGYRRHYIHISESPEPVMMRLIIFVRRVLPALILFALLCAPAAHSQDGRWQAHPSYRQAGDIAVSGEALWVTTSGGIYRYEPSSGETVGYSVSEGLHGTDVRAAAFDSANEALWIGYSDGVIDRVDSERGIVRSFYDIQRNDRYPTRGINRLVAQGDSLYIATDFGIVVFDVQPGKLEVRDTYAQLGTSATSGLPIHDIVRFRSQGDDYLAAATADGVSFARAGGANLQDPASWTFITTPDEVQSITYFRDRLYLGTSSGLSTLTLDGNPSSVSSMNDVRELIVEGSSLYGVNRSAVFEVSESGSLRTFRVDGYSSPRALAFGPAGRLWIADDEGGLLGLPDPLPPTSTVAAEISETYPQGPYHGTFSSIAIDADGTLWAGGESIAGTGLYRMAVDGSWSSFIPGHYPEMEGRHSYRDVAIDPSGGVWGASWGNAIIHISPDEGIEIYRETNSALMPITGSSTYVVVGGVATDVAGTLWATNMFTSERLVARTVEGEWVAASPRCEGFSPEGNLLDGVYVDSYGNKWFTLIAESNQRLRRGLLAFDSGASISDGDDDVCRYFNVEGGVGQGLPSTSVNSVMEDRDGRIWVGTETGPAYTQNSRLLPHSTGSVFIWPQPADRSEGNFLLFGVAIRDIAVDPSNRIWFATDNGAYVVEEQAGGGFAIVNHFRSDNSPLLSDAVSRIAVDGRRGRVFLNTDRGLISYQSESVDPVRTAGDLFIYPNPVVIEEGVEPIIRIRGLVEATELRIVTAAGDLVAAMTTRGGQASWDGRDRSGRLVGSGMYLVIAVGQNGEGRGVGKVAVVR